MAYTFSFRLYSVSLETLRKIGPLAREIARHDADLAPHLRTALTSIHLNIAEGMDAEGKIRCSRFRTALGSTNESIAAVDAADALGYIKLEPGTLDGLGHVVRATLLRLVMPKR